MRPGRGRVLVRHVETAETFPGGRIVLPETVREQLAAQQVEVIAVGAPTHCADEDCWRPHQGSVSQWTHEFPVKPGAWALVRKRSLVDAGTPGIYLCTQDDVLAVLTP